MAELQQTLPGVGPTIDLNVYSTRFQGSKRRVRDWLLPILLGTHPGLDVLDGFSGSGVVGYLLAKAGRRVTTCDRLLSSYWTTRCFLVDAQAAAVDTVEEIAQDATASSTGRLLDDYAGIFFPDNELEWLDGAATIIRRQEREARGVLFWALFQAALAKRPYNLFHRANLSMRVREVDRSFGNKTTWEKPFPDHFRKFVTEAERFMLPDATASAVVGAPENLDDARFDLIYLDPPYVNSRGVPTPYNDYYGFLDLLCSPGTQATVRRDRPHRPIAWEPSSWESAEGILSELPRLCTTHEDSVIALSYRSNGQPNPESLCNALSIADRVVRVETTPINYVLSKNKSDEMLIVSTPK